MTLPLSAPLASPLLKTAILTGTTASGKTALALEFARSHPEIEIINADSLLVYREMNIGTAKPTAQELSETRHHLIDLRAPDQPFTAGDFYREAHQAIQEIHSRKKRALIVGGTGFYLKALIYGLWKAPKGDPELRARLTALGDLDLYDRLSAQDPESAKRIGKNDHYRLVRANEILELTGKTPSQLENQSAPLPHPQFELLLIDRDWAELQSRISQRTEQMIRDGLLEEVKRLHESYPQARALQSVGYAETTAFLMGKKPAGRKVAPGLSGLRAEIDLGTRQLVKRQRTWFRGQTQAPVHILDRDRSLVLSRLKAVYSK